MDSAVLWSLSTAVSLGVALLSRWVGPAVVQTRWWSYLWLVPDVLISALYFTVLTQRYGATLGKLAFGLRVVSADGHPLRWQQVMLRETVGKWLSTLPLWLGFLRVIWSKNKQGLHDELAGTGVLIIKPSLYEYGKPGAIG